jgi:hypothetical protein
MQDKIMTRRASGYFENVKQLKCFRTRVIAQTMIRKEIKARLYSGTTCYLSVLNLLSSSLLSKNVKMRMHTNKILPVVLYG